MVVGIDNDSTGDSTQGERPEMILLNRGNLIYSFDYQVWRLFGKISLYYGSYYCNLFEQAAIKPPSSACLDIHSVSFFHGFGTWKCLVVRPSLIFLIGEAPYGLPRAQSSR